MHRWWTPYSKIVRKYSLKYYFLLSAMDFKKIFLQRRKTSPLLLVNCLRESAWLFHLFRHIFPKRHRPFPQGISPQDISKMLKKLRTTESVLNRPKPGRPRSARNEKNEVKVKKTRQSFKEIANETGGSITSIWRISRRPTG